MSGYRHGLEGPVLDYAMRKYRGHRLIPEGVVVQMEKQYEDRLNKKSKKRSREHSRVS